MFHQQWLNSEMRISTLFHWTLDKIHTTCMYVHVNTTHIHKQQEDILYKSICKQAVLSILK